MRRAAAPRSTTGETSRAGSTAVSSDLAELAARAEELLGRVDPERLDGDEVLAVLGWFSRLRRAGAAGEVLLARRVEEVGAYRRGGHRSTAALIAARTGTSPARAGEPVETAKRLGTCPRTKQALVSGVVSVEQAHAITAAARVVPEAEAHLLELADRETLRTLQERARDVRLEAEVDRLGWYRRQRAARSLTHGRDDEGMVWGRFRLPPDLGAAVVNRLEHQTDGEYRAADREGRPEGHDRYLADALVTLVTAASGGRGMSTTGGAERQPALLGPGGTAGSSGPGEADGAGRSTVAVRPAPRVDVVVHVSREALRRGSVEPGELCTVQGVGPIPLERARELLDDAFLKAVLVDGTRVETVRHLGRRIPAELRTALEVRSVLADGDVVCSVEGCDRRTGLPCGPGVPTPAQRG